MTLPQAVVSDFEGAEYFDVTKANGRIVLTPVRLNRADAVCAKLAELGLSETDVSEAVAWARRAKWPAYRRSIRQKTPVAVAVPVATLP